MKSGCSGALKPDRLGLSCKANNCSDAWTGELGVLTTHETSPWLSRADFGPSISTSRFSSSKMPPKFNLSFSNDLSSSLKKKLIAFYAGTASWPVLI